MLGGCSESRSIESESESCKNLQSLAGFLLQESGCKFCFCVQEECQKLKIENTRLKGGIANQSSILKSLQTGQQLQSPKQGKLLGFALCGHLLWIESCFAVEILMAK